MGTGWRGAGEHLQLPGTLAALGYAERAVGGVRFLDPPVREIPAGPFLMGSDLAHDQFASAIETPQHEVVLSSFCIARFPLTVAEYTYAVRSGVVSSPSENMSPGWLSQMRHPDHPVTNITWYQAGQYAQWLAHLTGVPWRLPTEAEWEKAARGTDARIYPWGDTWEPGRANTEESGRKETTPVQAFPGGASPYGVEDMVGNLTEWTSSLFSRYPYVSSDGREDAEAKGWRVFRGGSYLDVAQNVRAAFRAFLLPDQWPSFYHGGRLAFGK